MFLRSFITSGIIAALYTVLISYIFGNQMPSNSYAMYITLFTLWSMGFLSVVGYVYGRKLKRNFRGETGTIKWFDPSKG